jgi:hypothetical protein
LRDVVEFYNRVAEADGRGAELFRELPDQGRLLNNVAREVGARVGQPQNNRQRTANSDAYHITGLTTQTSMQKRNVA